LFFLLLFYSYYRFVVLIYFLFYFSRVQNKILNRRFSAVAIHTANLKLQTIENYLSENQQCP